MDQSAILASICADGTCIRSTYYSDTFREKLEINNSVKDYDITHISIPFELEKEEQLLKMAGITRDQLPVFYEKFGERLMKANNAVADLQSQEPGIFEALFPKVICFGIVRKKERGSDVYFVTEVMEPLLGSALISEEGSTYQNVLRIAVRLTTAVKTVHRAGGIMGPLDLRDLYLKEKRDGDFLMLGLPLYASESADYLLTVPRYTDALQIERSTARYDTRQLSVLLWSLLSGNTVNAVPNLTKAPRYASKELTEALRNGLAGNNGALDEILAELEKLLQKVSRGETSNYRIVFQEPERVDPLPMAPTEPRPEEIPTPAAPQVVESTRRPPQIITGVQTPMQPLYIVMPQTGPVPPESRVDHGSKPSRSPKHQKPIKVERSSAWLLVGITVFTTVLSIVFLLENLRLWQYFGYDTMLHFFESWHF